MADGDHSLLLLDFLETTEIHSQRVMLERMHAFEELNETKFRERFRFSKRTTAANTKQERLAYHALCLVNT